MSEAQMPKNEMPDVQYPSFYYRGEKKLELPTSGTMEIQFKVLSKSEHKRDDGPTHYECCIEVQGIEEVESDEPEAPTKRRVDAEEALDRIASAIKRGK
jgi:hypothetical protein